MTQHSPIAGFLSRAEAYADATRCVERIETHISWVFLTDHFAYKLKKPVRFDFLDFSTPELRRRACEEEVRLNRRLAKGVYLDVVPITQNAEGGYVLGGSGEAVDYVVKMVRLPSDRTLDRQIAAGRATAADLESLARRLSDFYRDLTLSAIEPHEYRGQIESHLRENLRELSNVAGIAVEQLIKRLHGAQLQFLLLSPQVFDKRVRNGRIVDGHGDLRPEHVYFLPEPVVLDCIEFNAEYRRIDVLDELGFLAMECDRLGAAELGTTVLRRCAEILEDDVPADLLAFYKSYRACVRAKVAGLRASQHAGPEREAALAECQSYLQLAAREAAPLLRSLVVLARGVSGTGKSTVAAALAERLGAQWLSTDAIRREMFPAETVRTAQGAEKYLPENRQAVYDELLHRADVLLLDGHSVVLDGTFLAAAQCRRAAEVAAGYRTPFLIVDCRCPDNVARKRIADRVLAGDSTSDAFPELLDQQQQTYEPPPAELAYHDADTSRGVNELVPEILESLGELYPPT